jgi:leishmanolysin
MRCFLLSFLPLLGIASAHRCTHDETFQGAKLIQDLDREVTTRLLAPTENLKQWRPIQIEFDFDLGSFQENNRALIQSHVMPQLADIFHNLLKVKYLPGFSLIPVQNSCTGLLGKTAMSGDLLLKVTSLEGDGQVRADAISCRTSDLFEGRPYIGRIRINEKILSLDPDKYRTFFNTLFHETCHILGVSRFLINTFPTVQGAALKAAVRRSVATNVLDLPDVVKWNQEHFNCPTVGPPEMENEGGTGAKGSHFELRNYRFEIMGPAAGRYISGLTLSTLQASGWYLVDMSQAQILPWGRGAGCGFVANPCIDDNGNAINEVFCTKQGDQGCQDGMSHAFCSKASDDPLASAFDHFRNGDAFPLYFMDNCPVYEEYADARCDNPLQKTDHPGAFEIHGANSRCFESNLFLQNQTKNLSAEVGNGRCYEFACLNNDDGDDYVRIWTSSHVIDCPPEGGRITLKDFAGYLQCPAGKSYCEIERKNFCPHLNHCGGVGVCFNNRCYCPLGRNSPDCLSW